MAKAGLSKIFSPQSPIIFKRIPTTGDLLLIRNPNVDLKHHHQGRRTPLRCTISSDEGRRWQHERDLESDPAFAWSYGSCTFVGDMVIFSYYKETLDGTIGTACGSCACLWPGSMGEGVRRFGAY